MEENGNSQQAWLVKAGMHAELQKFGQQPDTSAPWCDSLQEEVKGKVIKYKIDVIGIDYSDAQHKALFAIQKLLSKSKYKGNVQGSHLDGHNGLLYTGYLPGIQFKPSQYFDAYGVTKYRTTRGKYEYSGEQRREALEALKDLALEQNLLIYRRMRWLKDKKGKTQEVIDRIETVQPLIRITKGWEALNKSEDKLLDAGKSSKDTDDKLTVIAIEPCPILVDQIDNYFLLKPANYREEIALKVREWKVSKYTYLFIDYLMAQAELKRRAHEPLVLRKTIEELAYKLRMDPWIKKRMWKNVRGSLNKSYKIAKDLGYLLDYKTVPGKTLPEEVEELTLNPEKFAKAIAIREARKSMDLWIDAPQN
jgi:hypothetical protein